MVVAPVGFCSVILFGFCSVVLLSVSDRFLFGCPAVGFCYGWVGPYQHASLMRTSRFSETVASLLSGTFADWFADWFAERLPAS
jgi:hypothetical protein